jgi:hypothetical protein
MMKGRRMSQDEAPKIRTINDLVADRLIDALASPETATPGMLQAALRYLSDNGVTKDTIIEPGSAVDDILRSLPFGLTGTDD